MNNQNYFDIYKKDDNKSMLHILDFIYENLDCGYAPTIKELLNKTELSQPVIQSLKSKLIKCGILSEYNKTLKKHKILVSKDVAIKLAGVNNCTRDIVFKNENMYKDNENPKELLQIWADIIYEIKDDHYMNLYQQLKGSNAFLKDDCEVKIIIYNPKPINIEFLNKQSHIDIIENKLSKALKKIIHIKYIFKNMDEESSLLEFCYNNKDALKTAKKILDGVYKREVQFTLNNLNEIYGIEFLEYHNKNLLSGDNKSRCEEKLRLLQDSIKILSLIEK